MPIAARKATAKTNKTVSSQDALCVGAKVPTFSLPATANAKISTAALNGKPYVLYFYPKDDTSGCTAQACDFQSQLAKFSKLGVTVIGISKDTIESHEKFAKKYALSFPLASDKDNTVCETFGVWKQKSMYGRTYMGIERSTFLIDDKGFVRAMWRKVSVPGHIEAVRDAVSKL